MERIKKYDIVQNFKREFESEDSNKYLYKVLDVVCHSETMEKLVAYKALYEPFDIWVRPYDMFMSEVDKVKYPEVKQKYRFEKVNLTVERSVAIPQMDNYGFQELLEIISLLRSEEGCRWDRKQTLDSMKKCLADETQEVFEAIDKNDMPNLCEELGDVLLQVVMNSQIAMEEQKFTIDDVVEGVCNKLVRRHPHVFGTEEPAKTPEEALLRWEKIKKIEKE